MFKIVADENIDTRIILELRNRGYEIISIKEEYTGITDEKVIEVVKANHAYLGNCHRRIETSSISSG